MIEEAYEAAEAMSEGSPRELCEELGDVLLQVVLNAQLARDAGAFQISDVIAAIDAKMRRRHPHVFGDDAQRTRRSKGEIRANWETIKASEKTVKKKSPSTSETFHEKAQYPASLNAAQIGKTAARIKFDWPGPEPVLEQFLSEVDEMRREFKERSSPKARSRLAEELGDVYFSLAQLCRHLDLDPETVAIDGNRKFLRRFKKVEQLAAKRGIKIAGAPTNTLEALWQEAKSKG